MAEKTLGIVCSPNGFGGLEMNTLFLAKALAGKGWKVRLLVNEQSRMYAEAKKFSNDVSTIQQFKAGAAKATSSIIKKWLHTGAVDILFTPFSKDIAALAFYKRFINRKVKLVYQQHMKVGVNKKDLIHSFRYGALDLWISPLEYLKEETIQRTSVPASKIAVIPFGVDVKKFTDSTINKAEAREQLNLAQNAFVIGVLGRIDPKKGQDFLIRSLPYLRGHVSTNIELLIMGNITPHEGGDYLKKLYDFVKELKLESGVHFRAFNPEVMLFYKAIDVFAMPAHGETFGMVTIEAMASGVPVIGVGRDGTKELLQGGELGYLHELEDVKGFVAGIRYVVEGNGNKDMIERARKEVNSKYVAETMFVALDRALEVLL
jgi:D-inositol-3-phosphate glycosyltransferase